MIGRTGNSVRQLTITVIEIRGGKVKLGFDAEPGVSVQRSEVWAQIHAGDLPHDHFEDFGAPAVL